MLEIIFLLQLRKDIFLSELQQCPCGTRGLQQEPPSVFSAGKMGLKSGLQSLG